MHGQGTIVVCSRMVKPAAGRAIPWLDLGRTEVRTVGTVDERRIDLHNLKRATRPGGGSV